MRLQSLQNFPTDHIGINIPHHKAMSHSLTQLFQDVSFCIYTREHVGATGIISEFDFYNPTPLFAILTVMLERENENTSVQFTNYFTSMQYQ